LFLIDNEIFSKNDNDNGDNSNINKFVPKPQFHVSITGIELGDKLGKVMVMILFQEEMVTIISKENEG
jgi:Ca2+-binding RTX toxin-like protein